MIVVGDTFFVDELGSDGHRDQVPEGDDEVGGGVPGAKLPGLRDLGYQDGSQSVGSAESKAVDAGKHVVADDVVVGEPDSEERDNHHAGDHEHDVKATEEVAHEGGDNLAQDAAGVHDGDDEVARRLGQPAGGGVRGDVRDGQDDGELVEKHTQHQE